MAKVSLDNLSNIFTAATTINANNDKIEVALENTLSRDGTSPNTMDAVLDMNNHRVYNLPNAVDGGDAVAYRQVTDILSDLADLEEAVEAAEAAQEAAELAESNAEIYTAQAIVSAAEAAASAASLTYASEAEARAGIITNKIMSPYLTASSTSKRLSYIRLEDDKYVQLGLDPTNTTDSYTAIAAAFADLAIQGKKHIVISGGNYRQGSTLNLAGNDLRITFENNAMIHSAPGVFSPTLLNANGLSGLRIENPRYQGNNIPKPGVRGQTPVALNFGACHDMVITDPHMDGFKGINIAYVHQNDCRLIGGLITNHGQEAGAASGDAPGFAATPGFYCSGGLNTLVRDTSFKNGGFSAIFNFNGESTFDGVTMTNMGESAVYSEAIDPANNNGVEVRGNSYTNCKIYGTHVVDISAAGFECSARDQVIANNIITLCGTHGIGMGLANAQIAIGNMIGNCNQDNHAQAAGISISAYGPVFTIPSQQGDQNSVIGNVIYDQIGLMKSGIHWFSGDPTTYHFKRAVDRDNSFVGLPSYKDRVITSGAMEDGPSQIEGCVIGPDTSWKKTYVGSALSSTSNLTSAAPFPSPKKVTIPPHYMLNQGAVRIKAEGEVVNVASGNKVAQLFIGGVGIGGVTVPTTGSWSIECDMYNKTYNTQYLIFSYSVNGAKTTTTFSGNFNTESQLDIEIYGNVANASDTVVCNSLSVEKITG